MPTPSGAAERVIALDLGGGPRLYWLDGGGFRLDGGALFGPVPRPRWVEHYPPAEDNTVPLTAHVVLVELPSASASGSSWGLLDAGFGHHLNDRQRRAYTLERESQLEQGLAELGLSTTSIDWVILSHLHLDHAGGVLGRDGSSAVAPVFPNAPIWVQKLEAVEARDQTNRAHGMYTGDAFDRLEQLGLVHEVDGEAQIAPDVRVFLTGGHSRGHQATLIGRAPGSGASIGRAPNAGLSIDGSPSSGASSGRVPSSGMSIDSSPGSSGASSGSSPGAGASSGGAPEPGESIGGAPGSGASALLHMGDLLVTHAHLPPAWVSALDDFPLDSIRAKRVWLAQAAQRGWWVAFSHDVTTPAGLLDADARLRTAWPTHSPDSPTQSDSPNPV
jgi:glyoxylase-like metal-dependent hydrolase (beta-lactamase superfamily II)